MQTRYTFIHLESPYHTLILKEGQKYFSKIIQSRINSYQERYGNTVFPLGAEDFLCDFVALERNKDGKIVASFKYITDATCRLFSIPFPLLHTLENKVNPDYIYKNAAEYLEKCYLMKLNMGYVGSLTVNKESGETGQEKDGIKKLITVGIIQLTVEKKTDEMLVTGTVPNRSFEFNESLGLTRFTPELVTVWDIGRTTAYVQHWKAWSPEACKLADSFQHLWDARNLISANKLNRKKALAA